jgi:hypothetical protein
MPGMLTCRQQAQKLQPTVQSFRLLASKAAVQHARARVCVCILSCIPIYLDVACAHRQPTRTLYVLALGNDGARPCNILMDPVNWRRKHAPTSKHQK